MATPAQWLEGARLRTLPAAVAPVAAGTGAAVAADGFRPGPALLCLVVALALQVGVNYANDYSDGVRGTDTDRVGPLRLVGSGTASPDAVRAAAFTAFGVAAVAGLLLAALSSWWLIAVGAGCLLAAWFYTGGRSPYGYRGLGEVSVFVFFGLVATVGTTYVQALAVTWPSVAAGIGCGSLACALLVANNLRDRPKDAGVGKRTLAVLLGDRRTRLFYAGLMVLPFVTSVLLTFVHPWVVISLAAAVLAGRAARTVLSGAAGPALIPVLKTTGLTLLAYGALVGVGLALSAG